MRSFKSQWKVLFANKRRSVRPTRLLIYKLINNRLYKKRSHHFSFKPDYKQRIYSLISTCSIIFITLLLISHSSVNAAIFLDNDWSSTPYSEIDNIIVSIDNELSLGDRTVADSWCDTDICNNDFKYRKLVTINNTGGSQVENAIILVNIDYEPQMDLDFNDIRFVTMDTKNQDGTYSKGIDANYKMYSKTDGLTATVSLEIPILVQGQQQLYLYYGNQNALGTKYNSIFGDPSSNNFILTNLDNTITYKLNSVSSPNPRIDYIPDIGVSFRDIDNKFTTTCGITTDDQAYCWGSNTYGQLGNGNTTNSSVPVAVSGGLDFKEIAVGNSATCGITIDDQAYCWGYNNYGQLGNGNTISSNVPVAVSGGLDFKKITTSSSTTCGITTDDQAYCWGRNNYGQLGNGKDSIIRSPTAIPIAQKYISNNSGTDYYTVSLSPAQDIDDSTISGYITSKVISDLSKSILGNVSISTSGSGISKIKIRTDNNEDMSTATDWPNCNLLSSGDSIYDSTCVEPVSDYIQYRIYLSDTPETDLRVSSVNFQYEQDLVAPSTPTNIMIRQDSSSGRIIKDSSGNGNGFIGLWQKAIISWEEATDNIDGSGIAGYCLYFGPNPNPDFSQESGGFNPQINNMSNGLCKYATTNTSAEASPGVFGDERLYFVIKAFDNTYNFSPNTSVNLIYDYDSPRFNTVLSGPSGVSSSRAIPINWLTVPGDAPGDNGLGIYDLESGMIGLKYCIDNLMGIPKCDLEGDWFGPAGEPGGINNLTDVFSADTGQLITRADDPTMLDEGIFIVYILAIDKAHNYDGEAIIVTISNSPATAPTNLTVDPISSPTNSFSFSWSLPESYLGAASDIDYCWTVNEKINKNASNCNWTGKNVMSLPAGPFATKQDDNIFYLMAKNQAGVYDTESVATVTFNTKTPAPGPPSKLVITDVSVRNFDEPEKSVWRLAMSWDKPSVSLDLVDSYQVWRSTDGVNFGTRPVGLTSKSNMTFTDTVPKQETYYYKVVACDNANSCGMPSNIVNRYPTGHFTEPAKLTPGSIEVKDITTRRATIHWLTELESNSHVIFDTKPGLNPKNLVDVGNFIEQTKIHTVSLTGLQPGTKYYYKTRWTNIDDFTGESEELSFTTLPAPAVSEVETDKVTISGGTINFTVTNAHKMNLYYGKNESFGGLKTINTSPDKSTYSIALSDLDDDTKYYFKLNGFDLDGNEYQGFTFSFTTLPRPRIYNLRFQPIPGASSNTTEVSWTTNVLTSSELSYGLLGSRNSEVIDSELKTEHKITISGLEDDSDYVLVARSRDASGNLAISDSQVFRTALDTRPPIISDVLVESSITGSGVESRGQVVLSWTTDEPATSQVAYGQGAPDSYSNKTSEDSRLSTEHVVIISDLSTSSIYQLQPLSKDKAGNEAKGDNQSTIIGRGTENVFTIIFNSLRKIFGIKW